MRALVVALIFVAVAGAKVDRRVSQFRTAEGVLSKRPDGELVLAVPMMLPGDITPKPDRVYRLVVTKKWLADKTRGLVGKRVSVDGQTDVENGERVFFVENIFEVVEDNKVDDDED
jgi:hypothetical protein